jgi:hypothetical protein
MKIRIILVNIVVFLAFYFNVNSSWAQEVNGSVYSGTVKSSKSGKTWPATLKIIEHNSNTGRIVGELHWPNLGSIHKVVGQLSDNRLTFKETEYIKKGSAFLNCEYNASLKNELLTGNWSDPSGDNGSFQLSKQSGGLSNVNVITNNIAQTAYTGVVSSKSGKTWPATLKIVEHNLNTGRIIGELHWPNLGAIHKIIGQLSDSRLTFKETDYIKKGNANLNCEYNASLKNGLVSGNWSDPSGDNGTFKLNKD